MKVLLCLLSNKGLGLLQGIIKSNWHKTIKISVEIGTDVQVVNDYSAEISTLAQSAEIECILRGKAVYQDYSYVLAAGWRWLIKGVAEENLIVFHDSLLPRYRGFAPLMTALLNRDPMIGVTAIFGSTEYDRGDIISQFSTEITYPISVENAIKMIVPLYERLGDLISRFIVAGKIPRLPQNDALATYSLWRDEEDYFVNWNDDSDLIANKINALGFPYENAKTYMNGDLVSIVSAESVEDVFIENRDIGKVIFIINEFPIIVCASGLLKIIEGYFEDGRRLLPLVKFRSRFKNDSF